LAELPSRIRRLNPAGLRQYLAGPDHSFGEGHRFPAVYVLDKAIPGAADPASSGRTGSAVPIGVATQDAIKEALAGTTGPVTVA
jgi:hypothetical protein